MGSWCYDITSARLGEGRTLPADTRISSAGKPPLCQVNYVAKLSEKLARQEALVVESGDASDKVGAPL